jgi:hypothetical protein
MTKHTEKSLDLLSVALLVISVPVFFGRVIGSGKPLFGSDFVFYFHPLKKFIYDYFVTHGTVPLWNGHQFSGTPLIGNIQAAIFYPLGFLFYLIPTQQAYGYTIMLHCALGAIFMVTAGLIHLIHKRLARHSLAIAIFLAVITLDLWTFSNALIKTTDLGLDQKRMALLRDLNSDLEIHRIAVINDSRVPNDGLVYRYQDIQGYDPLILKRYLSYINKSQNTLRCSEAVNVGHVRDLDNHLIRMLNVKHAISNKTALLQTHNPLPRAYIVHKAMTVSSGKVLDFMMTDDFNPQDAVVFEDLQQQKAFSWSPRTAFGLGENGSPECSMTDGTEYCKVKAYKNEEFALSATMNHDGIWY